MFCHQCGKELYENARFCSNCGTPVREISAQTKTAEQAENNDADAGKTNLQTAVTSSGTTESAPPKAAHDKIPADLILKKGEICVTNRELHLNRSHYIRKPGKKNFQKEKSPSVIPFDSILGTSMEHHKYKGRIFLSMLLLICFTAGALFSFRYGYDAYNTLNIPYRTEDLAALESVLTVIENDGDGQLLQCQFEQKENRADADTLSAELAGLKTQQAREILSAVYNNDKFDLDTFFNREPFSRAYQDYLQELLDIFKTDEALHSWLYNYYEAAKEYSGNYLLDTDMWIYNGSGENMFSSILDSAASLMYDQYDSDLYEHILYTGRIYITGADFMQKILFLPRYTVDSAIFVKAHGGTPDTSEMFVPGWSRSQYEEFWLYSADYYNVDTPMWLDYGFQAENFGLDWNALINEAAYYNAYMNFMDKAAPGLPLYEMASYHADNAAYGGMGCDIRGTEASLSDIVFSYAENHPEFIDELKESEIYGRSMTISVDEEIARAETRLEKLEKEYLDLQEQEKELAQILANADIYRNNYTFLLADIKQHTQELISFLLLFSSTALLCMLNTIICLCIFFDFLKRPRHLFIVCSQDMDFAFSTKPFSKEQISALQNCLQQLLICTPP